MKICPKCGNQCADEVSFCSVCGTAMNGVPVSDVQQGQYVSQQSVVYVDPTDHTAEFDKKDISDNKVLAMVPYLLGWIGIIVALLAINNSKYVAFHVKQALKIEVLSAIVGICTLVLFFTIIVPVAGAVCLVILFVIKIISFFSVCSGKAKEPPIVKSFGFLK